MNITINPTMRSNSDLEIQRMDHSRFHEIEAKYGCKASWACWAPKVDSSVRSGMDNLKIFQPNHPLDSISCLHTKFVLVALNLSNVDEGETIPWCNFHSSSPRSTDWKLRYAVQDTELWGSYMTDLLNIVEVDSHKVMKHIKNNPIEEQDQIFNFKKELDFVCNEKPIIFALGGSVFGLLEKHLGSEFKIHKLYHYAARTISLDEYRSDCIRVLQSV